MSNSHNEQKNMRKRISLLPEKCKTSLHSTSLNGTKQWMTRSTAHWLCGGFPSPAAELALCCPPVRTRCLSAASPRSLRPGWLPPAACADSAHTQKHTDVLMITPQQSNMRYFRAHSHPPHHRRLETHKPMQLFRLKIRLQVRKCSTLDFLLL